MLTSPLLPYQVPAMEKFLAERGLLVTMDPGTGKTIVAIAAAEELLGRGEIRSCLCVVPASLKYQWAQRLAQFTDMPSVRVKAGKELITVAAPPYCVTVDGTQGQRDDAYAMIGPDTEYVILGYPNVLNDWQIVAALPWDMVVLDEITAVKNPGSDITRAVRDTFAVPWRLGLTGTPVENRPEELFAIMEWIAPGYLGDAATFDKAYVKRNSNGDVMRYKNLPVLHAQLQAVTYRKKRSDPDVAPYFPAEDEGTWLVDLPPDLRAAYLALAADLLDQLRAVRRRGTFDIAAAYRGGKPDEGTAVGRVAARMQAMEMLTCHPQLIVLSAQDYWQSEKARRRGEDKAAWPGSRWCHDIVNSAAILAGDAARRTPKLDYLTGQCREITSDPGTKILVYTKYTRMLPLLTAALEMDGTGTVTYSGEMTAGRKAGAIARFTDDPACRVFLSSHAGAYGCDMYMASHLVNYDIPWSGGKAEQINGRHVRASSTREVTYIRHLLARDSLDERKLAQVRFKRRIASAIIDGHGADHLGRIENDIGTLTEFLEDLLTRPG